MMGSWVPTDILLAHGDGNVGLLFFCYHLSKILSVEFRGRTFVSRYPLHRKGRRFEDLDCLERLALFFSIHWDPFEESLLDI